MPAEPPAEIAIVGDLTDNEADVCQRLLEIPPGGSCTIYFNSPGGNPYTALSLYTLIRLREIEALGIVTGECSSAALWPFGACSKRYVTAHSVALFHPLKWQSEEHVGLIEATEWAKHFARLERDMDVLLAELFGVSDELLSEWTRPHRYVTGPEMAEAGVAELIDPRTASLHRPQPRRRKSKS